jgi:RNA polymerase sigma factor (TIGR02999 family)
LLFERIYPELHAIARQRLSTERDAAESTESIVHECYLRLARGGLPEVENRGHFFALVSRLMRQILVDHARARTAQRRDHRLAQPLEAMNGVADSASEKPPLLVRLNDAMEEFAKIAPRPAQLVELRYFGGMTAEESAEYLGIGVQDVRREIRYAQSWLRRELGEDLGS